MTHRLSTLAALLALIAALAALGPAATRSWAGGGSPVAPLGPTSIAVGGGWRAFSWGTGAPVVAPDSPFTFTHAGSVVVTVVDVECVGDEFTVLEQGVPVGFSTKVTPDPECDDAEPATDPAAALDRPEYSRAVFLLPPGTHALDVQITTNMPGIRTAHIKVDAGACGSGPAAAGGSVGNPANRGRAGTSGSGPLATGLTVGGGWAPFSWGPGVPACAEEGPFAFSHSDSVTVTVVDASCRGDRFRVSEGPAVIGITSVVGMAFCPDTGDTDNPDAALAAGTYSSGAFTLPAGAHSLTLQAIANPHGAGQAFVRVDAAPANPCSFGSGGANGRPANAPQGAVTVNGGWTALGWGGGLPACSGDGPFSFTATGSVEVKVTTVGCRGAALKVYGQTGNLLHTTPAVGTGACPAPGDTLNPDTAFGDAGYSHGAFSLPAGAYALAVEAAGNPFGGGSGFLRVDSATVTPGGKNARITTGNPDLTWDGGDAQTAYFVLRAPIVPAAPVELLGPLGPSATSFDDATVAPGTFNCYLIAPLNGSTTLGFSDLLCSYDGIASGASVPGAFTLGLNQTATATLSWTAPPGGADSYLLVTIPIGGAGSATTPLPGTATSATHATGGTPTCYALIVVKGGGGGNSNLLCGFPGVSTLSGAAAAWEAVQGAGSVLTGAVQSGALKLQARLDAAAIPLP